MLPVVTENVAKSAVERVLLETRRYPRLNDGEKRTLKEYVNSVADKISKTNPHLSEYIMKLLIHGSALSSSSSETMLMGAVMADYMYRALNDQIEIDELESDWGSNG